MDTITSYNIFDSATINQVKRTYNGFGQLTKEYQSHSGAVDTSSTLSVAYGYSDAAHGSRLTTLTYPDATSIGYTYGTANGLNDVISRLDAIKQETLTLESYKYLGFSTVIERTQPQVRLTYLLQGMEALGDAGDKYNGLDRFGRVVDQRWMNGGSDVDRYQYAYDRNSNVTLKDNELDGNFTENYTYDGLSRLITVNRAFGSTHDQSFALDSAGNITGVTTNSVLVNRTANSQNQLTSIGGNSLTYDANGNLATDDQGRSYTFDTWNRLVAVNGTDGALIKAYAYDGFGRRIQEIVLDGNHDPVTTDLYFSASWQVVEEYVGGQKAESNVYSPVYVNAIIQRQDDTDGNGSLDRTNYFTSEANFNVTTVINHTGGTLQHFVYSAYGEKITTNGAWSLSSDILGVKNTYQGGREDFATGMINFQRRDYNPRTYTWNSADPLGYLDGVSLYPFVGGNPIIGMDPSGLAKEGQDGWTGGMVRPALEYKIDVAFDAFISVRRGSWLPEPVQWWPTPMHADFRSDERHFGRFNFNWEDGNARAYSMGTIDTRTIGRAASDPSSWASSRAGFSERRLSGYSIGFGRAIYSKARAMGGAEQKGEVLDTSPCTTVIHFKAAFAYPFRHGPNINYEMNFKFEVVAKNKVEVTVWGTRNDFPDYEYYIDRTLRWSKYSWFNGPGLISLAIAWSYVEPITYTLNADTGDRCPCAKSSVPSDSTNLNLAGFPDG